MEKLKMWNWLVDMGIATQEELERLVDTSGYSLEKMNNLLYVRTGYHSREEMDEKKQLAGIINADEIIEAVREIALIVDKKLNWGDDEK
ncbi:MAG: hypothetical protein M0R38_10060 [Bacteroidia bacterium]|nr:hypothetical protein [Bacteroidia bacterium]